MRLCVHTCMYMTEIHVNCFDVSCFSMEGGELFDSIQKKGHFTERGTQAYVYMYYT